MKTILIKLGGELTDRFDEIDLIVRKIRDLKEKKYNVVMVHGGGAQINEWSKKLGIPVKKMYGRRITDKDTLEVMQAVVAGLVNPNLVSSLRSAGINAAGLTGADAGLTYSVKRPPLQYGEEMIDYGLIGEIEKVDATYLNLLMANEVVPVISCLTWSKEEGILNINADTLACELAARLEETELVLLSSVSGVWDKDNNIIAELSYQDWNVGVDEGWITTGMQPKLENGFKALKNGVSSVVITNPAGWNANKGTWLKNDQ